MPNIPDFKPTQSIWGFLLASLLAHAFALMFWPVAPPAGMPGGAVLQVRLAPGVSMSGDSDDGEQSVTGQALAQAAHEMRKTAVAEPLESIEKAPTMARDAVSRPPSVKDGRDAATANASDRPAAHRRIWLGPTSPATAGEPSQVSADSVPADKIPADLGEEEAPPVRRVAAQAPTSRIERDADRPASVLQPSSSAEPAAATGGSAAASPVSGEQSGTGGDANQMIQAALREAMLPYFEYPLLARRRGWEGRVRIALSVRADGGLTDMQVLESSGYRVLDEAALEDLRQIGRLPQASNWLAGKEMDVILPVQYRFR